MNDIELATELYDLMTSFSPSQHQPTDVTKEAHRINVSDDFRKVIRTYDLRNITVPQLEIVLKKYNYFK